MMEPEEPEHDLRDLAQEWSTSVNGSYPAQTLSSWTFPSQSTEQWLGVTSDMVNQESMPWGDPNFDDFGAFEGNAFTGQDVFPGPEGEFDTQLSLLETEYSQQNTGNDEIWYTADIAASSQLTDVEGFQPSQPHDEPWNPQFPKMIDYNSGRVAFVDPSEFASDQSSSGTSPGSWTSTQESTDQDLQPVSVDTGPSLQNLGSSYRELKWEKTCVLAGGLQKIGDLRQGENNGRQRRGRKGTLTEQATKDANDMRKIHACWTCSNLKVKCSPGESCQPCLKRQISLSPYADRQCCRSISKDYGRLSFPQVLTSHFTKNDVENLINQNVQGFDDTSVPVEVTCQSGFAPMRLTVHIFRPKTNELLSHYHLIANGGIHSAFTEKPSAPVGILGVDLEDLRKSSMSYIQSMVANPRYPRLVMSEMKTTVGPEIRYRVLDIVYRYSRVIEDPMLRKALEIYAMHHFMRTIIIFTDESAVTVARLSKNVLGPTYHQPRYDSSRLLGRQLKHAMHHLHKNQTEKLFKDFESRLKKRDGADWPILFSILVILCLATEDIQVAIDNFVANDTQVFHEFRQSHQDCWNLEDRLYGQLTQLFHDVYHTHKTGGAFNPFLDGEICASLSQGVQTMLSKIDQLIQDFDLGMSNFSATPVIDNNQFLVDNQAFIRYNPGRLVSKFLLSFQAQRGDGE